jgi:hypothetical protein
LITDLANSFLFSIQILLFERKKIERKQDGIYIIKSENRKYKPFSQTELTLALLNPFF